MNKKRPINLDLTTIKLPIMGLVSILHRLSGIGLFLLLPFVLYCLNQSLIDASSFAELGFLLAKPFYKVLIGIFSAALLYHLIAGIRHLLMDFGIGEGLVAGRISAIIVLILTVIFTLMMGVWLW